MTSWPDGPYVTLVRTPAFGSYERSGPKNGRYPSYDIAVMRAPSTLQGIRCAIPEGEMDRCMANLRLFLSTSRLTRDLTSEQYRQIVSTAHRILR